MILREPATVVLVAGSVWKAVDLARAPFDRALRVLVASLLLLTAGELLGFPAVLSATDAVTAAGVGELASGAASMAGLAALTVFFVSSLRGGYRENRARMRFEAALLGAVVAALALCTLATPEALRGHPPGTPGAARTSLAAFAVIGNGYLLYACLASALWAGRYARPAGRHLALGLRTVTLGLGVVALASAARMVRAGLRTGGPGPHPAFDTGGWSPDDWGTGLVLAGLCYAAGAQLVAYVRSVLHHRRMYEGLAPLWTVLADAYPELVLTREPERTRFGRLGLRHTHARFYRRLIECRDALVRLSPYLARVAPADDLAGGPADRLARHIAEALALKPAVEDPNAALSATRVAFPSASGLGADARELVAVSQAYANRAR
ncbi:MAB_1171c family putative transporter [Kitasatospora sp. NPDC059463]|uniref:MAB_1171c family putative transporter n=1 Tax=unclassified Kitasatospora TaxID=2633591 RepID=UPI0036CFD1D0